MNLSEKLQYFIEKTQEEQGQYLIDHPIKASVRSGIKNAPKNALIGAGLGAAIGHLAGTGIGKGIKKGLGASVKGTILGVALGVLASSITKAAAIAKIRKSIKDKGVARVEKELATLDNHIKNMDDNKSKGVLGSLSNTVKAEIERAKRAKELKAGLKLIP